MRLDTRMTANEGIIARRAEARGGTIPWRSDDPADAPMFQAIAENDAIRTGRARGWTETRIRSAIREGRLPI